MRCRLEMFGSLLVLTIADCLKKRWRERRLTRTNSQDRPTIDRMFVEEAGRCLSCNEAFAKRSLQEALQRVAEIIRESALGTVMFVYTKSAHTPPLSPTVTYSNRPTQTEKDQIRFFS